MPELSAPDWEQAARGQTPRDRIRIGEWTPIAHSPAYHISVLLVAAGMVCFPLLYWGLVAGIAWLTWYHASRHTKWFGFEGQNTFVTFVAYFVPLILGVTVVLFLMKPLVASRPRRSRAMVLDAIADERLHRFVYHICDLMGAARPRVIEIDTSVNAAARLRRGWLSLLLPRDMALVIGAPLVSGMTVEQFAGVMAHEFGHFGQGAAMRSWFLIMNVVGWLGRAAYGRDRWDTGLEALAYAHSKPVTRLCWRVVERCVAGAKLAVAGLYWTACMVGSHMSRQMEYDADRYECRLVGTRVFVATSRRLVALGRAEAAADRIAADMWARRREVPDDLAALVADVLEDLDPEAVDEEARRMDASSQRVFKTHPSMHARMDAARALDEPGILQSDLPATVLFSDFGAASRDATSRHFDAKLGGARCTVTFVPTGPLIEARRARRMRQAIQEKFVGFRPPAGRPLFLPPGEWRAPEEAGRAFAKVRSARARIAESRPLLEQAAEQFRSASDGLARCAAARALLDAGVTRMPAGLGVRKASPHTLEAMKGELLSKAARSTAVLDGGLELAGMRAMLLLRLLLVRAVSGLVPEPTLLKPRAKALLRAHGALREAWPAVREVQERVAILDTLLGAPIGSTPALGHVTGTVRIADELGSRIDAVLEPFRATPNPFAPPGEARTLADSLAPNPDYPRDVDEVARRASGFVERFLEFHARVLTGLLEIADLVESSIESAGKRGGAV